MYSLIFHEFIGQNDTRAAAFDSAFGQRGCYMSLASNSTKHTPCELAENLTREDAERKAAILREAGMEVEIVPTADVANVKHRASECWPTHRASNGECFTEWNNGRYCLVRRGVSLYFKEEREKWRAHYPQGAPWECEVFDNHEHPTHTFDRYGLRMARERGAELGAALTECFPDRRFLLVYRDEMVSFCQFTEDLLLGITPGNRSVIGLRVPRNEEEVCFCEVCECRVAFVIRTQPDAEFPSAQFADCAVCGSEVILWADHENVLASDAAVRPPYPAPDVPVDWVASPAQVPSSFAELKVAVLDRLHPSRAWTRAAIRHWLNRDLDDPDEIRIGKPLLARLLLQIEELTALLLAYRTRQLSLPPEEQDRTPITPQRLGIARSNPLYHPVRRALAPVTVLTRLGETATNHTLLNATDTHYTAGRCVDPNRRIYTGHFGYGVLNTRSRNGYDLAPHGANSWTWATYGAGSSLKFIHAQVTERCLAFTVLSDEQKRLIAQHRLLFRPFHELDIEPNPTITLDVEDGVLTLRSDVFVWGVLLGWRNSAELADNAFDLLPGIPYSMPWDEAVCGTPKIIRIGTGNNLLHQL